MTTQPSIADTLARDRELLATVASCVDKADQGHTTTAHPYCSGCATLEESLLDRVPKLLDVVEAATTLADSCVLHDDRPPYEDWKRLVTVLDAYASA